VVFEWYEEFPEYYFGPKGVSCTFLRTGRTAAVDPASRNGKSETL
jgi:hypothetical protein